GCAARLLLRGRRGRGGGDRRADRDQGRRARERSPRPVVPRDRPAWRRRMSGFRVEVRVMPRAALLDPQGQAVEHALHALGFGDVGRVRMGKHLVLELKAATREEALAQARAMCDRLLANPVTEDYDLVVDGDTSR